MGNTNYCLMMPRNEFNRTIACELLVNGLHQLDIPAKMNERHDIVIDDKKVSGSAYKIANHRAYHHGTMLIDTDLELVQRTLEPSKRVLDGGGIHSVRSQVTNLRQYSFTVDHTSFVEEITHQFGKKYGHQPLVEIDDGILNEPKIKDIMETMQTREWLLGQTPPFKQQIQVQGHSIVLSVRKAIVVQIDAPTLPHTHKKSLEILLDVPYESIPKLLEQSNSDFLLEIKNKF
ncbi:hypothetical protein EDD86DRAFT_201367 [Gorgonomyces haynaldii]|nr:hypothetical protein EDD86DRAFT_201367 [Gorgonomyces haynaldii]